MKVLVATHASQGDDSGDYCWTVDGELVTPIGLVCDNKQCGCERGFPGLGSSYATTTALVVDLAHIGPAELEIAVRDSLQRGGWILDTTGQRQVPPELRIAYSYLDDDDEDHDEDDDDEVVSDEEFIAAHMRAIIEAANSYPTGTILCRSHDLVFAREALAA